MVNPIADPGVLAFAILTFIMFASAGAAAMPPAPQIRLFIGALIIAAMWTVVTISFGQFSISTRALFIIDIGAAIVFYFLSKPELDNDSNIVRNNDWASYVCVTFILIAVIEFIGSTKYYDYQAKYALIIITSIIWIFIGIGLLRGYSLRAFGIFSSMSLLILACIFAAYSLTLNLVSLIPMFIITFKSFQAILERYKK